MERSRPERQTDIADVTGISYFLVLSGPNNVMLVNIRMSRDFVSKIHNCKNPHGPLSTSTVFRSGCFCSDYSGRIKTSVYKIIKYSLLGKSVLHSVLNRSPMIHFCNFLYNEVERIILQ